MWTEKWTNTASFYYFLWKNAQTLSFVRAKHIKQEKDMKRKKQHAIISII